METRQNPEQLARRSESTAPNSALSAANQSRIAGSATNGAAQKNRLLSMPGELRNDIFSRAISYGHIDIADFHDHASVRYFQRPHCIVSKEFADACCAHSVFVFDVRITFRRHGYDLDHAVWRPWLQRLGERAQMIRHIRVSTSTFLAVIYIDRSQPKLSGAVRVEFGQTNRKPKFAAETRRLIELFWPKLASFNARVAGIKVTSEDLTELVQEILLAVPDCCNPSLMRRSCNPLDGSETLDQVPRDAFCEHCRMPFHDPEAAHFNLLASDQTKRLNPKDMLDGFLMHSPNSR